MKLFLLTSLLSLVVFQPASLFSQVALPLSPMLITSPYGFRNHPTTRLRDFHSGVDLAANHSIIYAVLAGKVISCGDHLTLGKFIRIAHGEIQSVYGHLSVIFRRQGDWVKAGDPIGVSGNSGRSTAEHLHFSVLYQNRPIHPLKFLLQLQNGEKGGGDG